MNFETIIGIIGGVFTAVSSWFIMKIIQDFLSNWLEFKRLKNENMLTEGDTIRVGSVEGEVVKFGMYGLVLKVHEENRTQRISVPLKFVLSNPVTNFKYKAKEHKEGDD